MGVGQRRPDFSLPRPRRRPLQIFAFDPMRGRSVGNRATIHVQNEPLRRGPRGSRLAVVDYDGPNACYYPPVDLDDPNVLMGGGLEPSETDPRFHQQMVYAVGMKVIENFERALGRPFRFRGGRPLTLIPHAFIGENAYFDPYMGAVLFGYFRADDRDPGPHNLPGQTIYACLSHDIISHEVTHAIVHRLRKRLVEPTSADVLALHEGFSDIVAVFQHFTFREALVDAVRSSRGELGKVDPMRVPLLNLAEQFGYARGDGQALRSAVTSRDALSYDRTTEPHARGSILVAAVFDAFLGLFQRRTRDLVRIATGGTGHLPPGDLPPDLTDRMVRAATETAQTMLTMCIRAFEYLPPVHASFGDYLRALVTADRELAPDDDDGRRELLIAAFRARGIHPVGVTSLSEESLLLDRPEPGAVTAMPPQVLDELAATLRRSVVRAANGGTAAAADSVDEEQEDGVQDKIPHIHGFLKDNAAGLLLDPGRPIAIEGAHASFRVDQDGQMVVELVIQATQKDDDQKASLGGLPFRGGTTLIVGADGHVRYCIAKPLTDVGPKGAGSASSRLDRHRAYRDEADLGDPRSPYLSEQKHAQRAKARAVAPFGLLHARRAR